MKPFSIFVTSVVVAFLFSVPSYGQSDSGITLDDIIHEAEESGSDTMVAQNRRSSRGNLTARGKLSIFRKAKALAASGQYAEASQIYFRMSRSPMFREQHTEIKYILGLMLYEMKMYQVSAFAFYDVINREARQSRNSRYLGQAIEKLAQVSNILGNDVLLKFAISKIRTDQFPSSQRDLLYYRLGELKLKDNHFDEAARIFARVPTESSFYPLAKYKQAMAHAEMNQLRLAASAFKDLEQYSTPAGVTNVNRVNAMLGIARVLYQAKDYENALEIYRQIPRDTFQWHDSLFERAWAMLLTGKFRSALSDFHTLHSAYYEDFYIPESLILRSIVYLYICAWDEMEKTLNLFDKIYRPVHKSVVDFLQANGDDEVYLKQLQIAFRELENPEGDLDAAKKQLRLPYLVVRRILKNNDVNESLRYLDRLNQEMNVVNGLSTEWRRSGVGQYATRILLRRQESTKRVLGRLSKVHLTNMRSELRSFFEQADFLRLEQVNGKKEVVKAQIAGKGVVGKRVDQDTQRDFYVQNGYEYWPFDGEYWLDELGNYHYVGVQKCPK